MSTNEPRNIREYVEKNIPQESLDSFLELFLEIREDIITALITHDKTKREIVLTDLKKGYHGLIRGAYRVDDEIYLAMKVGKREKHIVLCEVPKYLLVQKLYPFNFD